MECITLNELELEKNANEDKDKENKFIFDDMLIDIFNKNIKQCFEENCNKPFVIQQREILKELYNKCHKDFPKSSILKWYNDNMEKKLDWSEIIFAYQDAGWDVRYYYNNHSMYWVEYRATMGWCFQFTKK